MWRDFLDMLDDMFRDPAGVVLGVILLWLCAFLVAGALWCCFWLANFAFVDWQRDRGVIASVEFEAEHYYTTTQMVGKVPVTTMHHVPDTWHTSVRVGRETAWVDSRTPVETGTRVELWVRHGRINGAIAGAFDDR